MITPRVAKLGSEPTETAPFPPRGQATGRGLAPHQEAQTLSDEICWCTSNSIHTGADDRRALRHKPRRRSGQGVGAGAPQRWRKSTEGCRMP